MEPVEAVDAGEGRRGRSSGGATRKRQPKGELRQLMLDTGRRVLEEEGIETVSSNLTFKRVFTRVEADTGRRLTNASVIRRIWENQSDYQADVLVAIANDEERPEVGETIAAVQAVMGAVDLTTVEGRIRGMSELCRVAGATSRQVIAESNSWALWVSVVAIASSTSNDALRERMCGALTDGYQSVTAFWESVYRGLLDILGLRPRAPLTVQQFVVAVTSLSEGDSLRQHVERAPISLDLPTGPAGELTEWTLYSVTIEAIALRFFEPDPDFVPPGA